MKKILFAAALLLGLGILAVSCNKAISPNELPGKWVYEKTERYDVNGNLTATTDDTELLQQSHYDSFFFHNDGSGYAGYNINFTYKIDSDIITLSSYYYPLDGWQFKKRNNRLISEHDWIDLDKYEQTGERVVKGRQVLYYKKQ